MPERMAPANVFLIPKESLTAAVRVYERKESGRYGFTLVADDQNATLVQDTASGDVYFTDSVIAGSIITLIRNRMAILALPLV